MTTYTVEAERGKRGGWVFQCVEHPGAISESRRLGDAEPLMKEIISFVAGVPEDSISIRLVPKLPEMLSTEIRRARDAAKEVQRVQTLAAKLSRKAVEDLRKLGLTGRDVATVLGVSPQRISQLMRGAKSGDPSTDELREPKLADSKRARSGRAKPVTAKNKRERQLT